MDTKKYSYSVSHTINLAGKKNSYFSVAAYEFKNSISNIIGMSDDNTSYSMEFFEIHKPASNRISAPAEDSCFSMGDSRDRNLASNNEYSLFMDGPEYQNSALDRLQLADEDSNFLVGGSEDSASNIKSKKEDSFFFSEAKEDQTQS